MKEIIINALISCDWWNAKVKSGKEMSPSSSIEDIAEYLSQEFSRHYISKYDFSSKNRPSVLSQ